MAKHIVKCPICGVSFDSNSIQSVRYGARRYAHQTCYPEGEIVPMELPKTKKTTEVQELMNYIEEILGDTMNKAKVKRQIKEYVDEFGYTYSGIRKTLHYWYRIKNNSIEKSMGGIGIVPFVYKESEKYYYDVYMANKALELELTGIKIKEERIINIFSPITKVKALKLFKLSDSEDNKNGK